MHQKIDSVGGNPHLQGSLKLLFQEAQGCKEKVRKINKQTQCQHTLAQDRCPAATGAGAWNWGQMHETW